MSLFLFSKTAFADEPADPPKVYFSELMVYGSSISTADEWIELYNDSDKTIDLAGWSIFDEATDKEMVKIPAGKVAAKKYFLISNSAKDYTFSKGESILDVDPDLVDSAISLSNDHFKISLRDNLSKTIDVAGDGGKPFVEKVAPIKSIQRVDIEKSGDESEAWQASTERKNLDSSALELATPEAAGKIAEPVGGFQESDQVKIYELLPHPKSVDWNGDGKVDSKDEWIELVNFGDVAVKLENWQIKDKSGKTFALPEATIAPQGFLLFYNLQTKISLNDDGEQIFLFSPDGKIADTIGYVGAQSKYDSSFAKWGDRWFWTTTPTPSEINKITESGILTNPARSQITEAQNKQTTLSGKVSELDRNGFSIESAGSTIWVILNDGQANLQVGDQIKLAGRLTGGEFPQISASAKDLMLYTGQSSKTTSNNQTAVILEKSKFYKKTTKRKTTKGVKLKNKKSLPKVLGWQNQVADPSKPGRFLLYLTGAIAFITVILLYEVSSPKRE